MINEFLTEKDILDYLMTSDFNEGLTHDEFKFLLLKYKSYYRIIYSKNERLKYTVDELEEKLKISETDIEKIRDELTNTTKNLTEELDKEVNRKLTWKERFLGKKIKIKNAD